MEYNQQRPQYPQQPHRDNTNGYYQNTQPADTYNQPQVQNVQPTEGEKTEEKAEKTPITKTDVIIVVSVLLWIAATIIAAIVLVSITGNIGWGIVSLGQFVFITGIILRIGDKDKNGSKVYKGWLLTGFISLVAGITLVITKPAFLNNIWNVVLYLIVTLFLAIAIIRLYDHTSGEKHKKERCKIPVQAEIIDHLRGTSYYTQGVYPLFRYTYNGTVYKIEDHIHAPREKVPPKGSYITLYINENNPKEFYCDWNGRNNSKNVQIGRYVGLIIFWVITYFIIPFVTKQL